MSPLCPLAYIQGRSCDAPGDRNLPVRIETYDLALTKGVLYRPATAATRAQRYETLGWVAPARWSSADHSQTIAKTASFLCRDVAVVRAKMKELRLTDQPGKWRVVL